MLRDIIGEITDKLEREGKIKILSEKEIYEMKKRIDDEVRDFRREYNQKALESEIAAGKIYITC